jgi:CRP-like cAMP-binding protein
MLDETLRSNFLFCHLSDGEKRLLYGQMERLEVAPGDAVITQGEQGDAFFVVERGEFDVYVSKGGAGASPSLVHTYVSRPDHHPTFGELALLYGKPRAATVRARTAGALWQLSRAAYKGVLRKKPPQSVSRKLRKVEALAPLRMSQLQRLSAALSPRYFDDGAVIVRQGEAADVFFFITAGEAMCAVRKNAGDDAESAKDALCLSAGQWFGEKALAGPGATRAATVTARGQVKLLSISRTTFEELFGPLAAITAAKRRWQESCAAQREALRGILGAAALTPPDSLSDLQPVATLFTSETTTVRLYEHKFVGCSFTVRLTSVAEATARGKQAAVLGARAISRSLAPCMYVPHVVAAFKTPNALSELLPSSPLCTLEHLVAGGGAGCVEPEVARFLAAGLVSALDHLHFSGLIYRGLSAHTVLLTDGGVVQLVDMRFAKRSEGKTFTMCGAREYLAPEMLDSAGHTEAVDWWALGALLFYMLTGRTPFAEPGGGGNELALFKRVLAPDAAPSFPPDFPPDARELVTALLTRDPARRLGNTAGGAAAIRGHAYFAGTDWDGLERRLVFDVPPALLARLASFRLPRLTKFDLARPTGDTSWTRDF